MLCSSFAIAVSAFTAQAAPVWEKTDLSRSNSATTASPEPFSAVTDITRSGLSNTDETAQHESESVVLITPAQGKVISVETQNVRSGSTHSAALVDGANADQMVNIASDAVSTTVDPSALSITTTSNIGGKDFIPSPGTVGPEPSSLVLAGSILVGLGMFKISRRIVG